MIKRIILLCCCLGLSACDQLKVSPVSLEGEPIVGHWFVEQRDQIGSEMFFQRLYLHIRADGYVRYVNLLCRSDENQLRNESRLNLDYTPVKRITVKKMVLQRFPLTPKFILSLGQWPDENNGIFEVDKLPLAQIESNQLPDFDAWQCE